MDLYFRGSVNRWECDENDHLNVRFFVEKHWQSLCAAAAFIGLPAPANPDAYISALKTQHLRFLAEARISTPVSGYVAVVGYTAGRLDILTELRHSHTQVPLSTCLHGLQLELQRTSTVFDIPVHAQPRGLSASDLPHARLKLEAALNSGFFTVGKGMATSEDCTAELEMRVHHYMGRVSDGMPHLWERFDGFDNTGDKTIADVEEGGAVLEYRMHYHRPLRFGDTFEIVSGVRAVSPKVQQFAHLIFHAVDGRIAASAQAAAVRMDLQKRRAIALPEARLAALRSQLISPLTD